MTTTINNVSIFTIAERFCFDNNLKYRRNAYLAAHDCIHVFTGLSLSEVDEVIVREIQNYFVSNIVPSVKAQVYIIRLKQKGVYAEVKQALVSNYPF